MKDIYLQNFRRIDYLLIHLLGNNLGPGKRIWLELQRLERLECEKKFIVDVDSIIIIKNQQEIPFSYDDTRFPTLSLDNRFTFQGRLFPKNEPYCRASYLIKITLLEAYPHTEPEVILLDSIYHPNVDDSGRICCKSRFENSWTYMATTTLVSIVENIIDIIDNPTRVHECDNPRAKEYAQDPEIFQSKALEHILRHGRLRC